MTVLFSNFVKLEIVNFSVQVILS
uniref:Uncharacterized protein n=1 Tax=Anguilla anguilla TaxID=7936 RepID=A0A0E9UAN2_ANGAN